MSMGSSPKQTSTPVNYKSLMAPEQLQGIKTLGPQLINEAQMALQGYGLTPGERQRQELQMTGRVNDYAGGMRDSVLGGYAAHGVEGGVRDSALKNLDTSKLMAFSSGLRDIEDMNQAQMQQKIANGLGFMTWAPPVAQKTKAGGFSWGLAAPPPPSPGGQP